MVQGSDVGRSPVECLYRSVARGGQLLLDFLQQLMLLSSPLEPATMAMATSTWSCGCDDDIDTGLRERRHRHGVVAVTMTSARGCGCDDDIDTGVMTSTRVMAVI